MSQDIPDGGAARCSFVSKARLVITAVIVEGRTQAEVAATYGVSQVWVYQADGPLPGRGRGRVRAAVPTARRPHRPRSTGDWSTLILAAPQRAGRRRPGRRPRHHRLAPRAPPPGHRVPVDDQPPPDPRRTRHPRAEEATQVLLHPVRSRHAQRDLAVRLHPLPTHDPTAPTSRSSPGSTTAPATPCTSPPTAGSPARSSPPPSAQAAAHMGSRPPP